MNWWRRIVLKIRSPKKKYQTEAERTRNSKQVRGKIIFEEGVSILSWLAALKYHGQPKITMGNSVTQVTFRIRYVQTKVQAIWWWFSESHYSLYPYKSIIHCCLKVLFSLSNISSSMYTGLQWFLISVNFLRNTCSMQAIGKK